MKPLPSRSPVASAIAALGLTATLVASPIAGRPGRAGAAEPTAGSARARLVCETDAVWPGATALLGVAFEIDDGWHLFWDGCNDTGYPISVRPDLPEGFRARKVEWPAPKRLVSPGAILDHVYEDEVLLILPIEIPAGAAPGSEVVLRCALEWVECREACVIGGGDVAIRLPVVASSSAVKRSADAPLFKKARARVPRPLASDDGWLRARRSSESLVVEAAGARAIAFFPRGACESLVDPIADCAVRSDRLEVRYRPVNGTLGPVFGVLQIDRDGEPAPRFVAIEVPMSAIDSSLSTGSH